MIRPNAAVAALAPYVPPSGRDPRQLLLDFNENTAGAPAGACRALARLSAGDLARYPELGPWRARLAKRLGLSPAKLFLVPGTDEAIAALIGAYGRPEKGDEVLYPVPTFGMYRFYADRGGLKRREVRFGRDLAYPVGALLKAVTPKTRLLFLASPNNPTGSVLARAGLEALLRRASKALVAVDEAYIEFGGKSALPLLARHRNLVVLRTFSKAYGLAGLRVGWLAGHPDVVEVLERAASPYRVSTVALAAAEAALAERPRILRDAAAVRRERAWLRDELGRRGLAVPASDGNFLLLPLGPAARKVLKRLASDRIRLRDRSADPGLDGVLRVTVGTPPQMRRFLAALDRALGTERNA